LGIAATAIRGGKQIERGNAEPVFMLKD